MTNQLSRSSKSLFFSAYRSAEGDRLRFVHDLRPLLVPILVILLAAIGYALYEPSMHPLSWIVLVPALLFATCIFLPLYQRVELDLVNHTISRARGSIFSEKTRDETVHVFQETHARPHGRTGRYALILTADKKCYLLMGNLPKSSAFLAVRDITTAIAAN